MDAVAGRLENQPREQSAQGHQRFLSGETIQVGLHISAPIRGCSCIAGNIRGCCLFVQAPLTVVVHIGIIVAAIG